MPEFIRSGMAGAMNGNTMPVPPPASRGSNVDSGGTQRAATASAGHGGSGHAFRPHSITQMLTFNVAKALGKAAGRNNADNN